MDVLVYCVKSGGNGFGVVGFVFFLFGLFICGVLLLFGLLFSFFGMF